jgi:hypothetical protein
MSEAGELEAPGGPSRQWAAGAVAVLLAVAIVAGLLFVHHRGSASPAPAGQPAASGHPIGALTMTAQLDFHCALPVQTYSPRAFVSMPDGAVTEDRTLTSARPVVKSPGSSYAGGRWLPVPTAWVSADGSSYAYITRTTSAPSAAPTSAPSAAPTSAPSAATPTSARSAATSLSLVPDSAVSSTLFVHDVARDADRQLWSGGESAQMIGWGSGGVYFIREGTPGDVFMELWAVDPSGHGGAHRVGPKSARPAGGPSDVVPALLQAGTLIAGGAAWTTSYGSLQKLALPGDAGAVNAPFGVIRMDLKDGRVTSWFTAPAATSVSIAAVDQKGHPVLILNSIRKPVRQPGASALILPWPQPPRVLLLTGPNQTVEIASGTDPFFTPSGH